MMMQGARRANEGLMWSVEQLAALGIFLMVVVVSELALPAAREAAEGFGLVLRVGFGCLGRSAVGC